MEKKSKLVGGEELKKLLSGVEAAMEGLEGKGLACQEKLCVLAMAAGILVEHLLDKHLLDGDTSEKIRPVIVEAFAQDFRGAMTHARKMLPEVFRHEEQFTFPTLMGNKSTTVVH